MRLAPWAAGTTTAGVESWPRLRGGLRHLGAGFLVQFSSLVSFHFVIEGELQHALQRAVDPLHEVFGVRLRPNGFPSTVIHTGMVAANGYGRRIGSRVYFAFT